MIDQPRRERMFNVPAAIIGLLIVLGLIQAVLMFALTAEQTTEFLLLFAFIPARYDASMLSDIAWPGGWAANIWTFVTYALIHADLSHLLFNAVWLLAFGSPVAQRFGSLRFTAFMALTAAAGAAAHLMTHFGELLPMVGASAAISGAMAAAIRFAFQRGGPLELWRDRAEARIRRLRSRARVPRLSRRPIASRGFSVTSTTRIEAPVFPGSGFRLAPRPFSASAGVAALFCSDRNSFMRLLSS